MSERVGSWCVWFSRRGFHRMLTPCFRARSGCCGRVLGVVEKTVGVRYTAPAPVVAGLVARTAAGGSLREALIASRPVAQCGVRWCVCGVAPCWSAVVCVWTMHTSADPITPETDAGARKFGHADGSHWRLAFRAPYTPPHTCRARVRTSGSALTIRVDGRCSRFGYTPPPKARIAGTAKSDAAVLFN